MDARPCLICGEPEGDTIGTASRPHPPHAPHPYCDEPHHRYQPDERASMVDLQQFDAELASARTRLTIAAENHASAYDRAIQENHEADTVLAQVPETRDHFEEEKAHFENGATRSVKKARFELIPHEIDEALAYRFALGAEKHGESNWQGGEEDFILGCINHGRDHIGSFLQNGPWHSDDDLGAILWNFGVLTWFRKHKPEAFRRAMKRINPNWEA